MLVPSPENRSLFMVFGRFLVDFFYFVVMTALGGYGWNGGRAEEEEARDLCGDRE